MIEAQLERYFYLRVKLALGGIPVKLAPVQRGVPDRMVLLPGGRIHLVELKTNKGRLSEIQKHWHSRAEEVGCRVAVLRGKDDVDQWVLKMLEKEK